MFLVAAPGSTPQSVPSYFSVSSGLDKQAETSVVRVLHYPVLSQSLSIVVVTFPQWSVSLITGALALQWINTDSCTLTRVVLIILLIHVLSSHSGDDCVRTIQSRIRWRRSGCLPQQIPCSSHHSRELLFSVAEK